MSYNSLVKFISMGSLTIGSVCLTVAFNGGPAMVTGIILVAFAVMTAARYPYDGNRS